MTEPSRPSAGKRGFRAAAAILVVLMATTMLAGCGKKGSPVPPADQPNTYPQPYPRD